MDCKGKQDEANEDTKSSHMITRSSEEPLNSFELNAGEVESLLMEGNEVVNIKEANKQTAIYVGRSLTDLGPAHLCFMLIDYA